MPDEHKPDAQAPPDPFSAMHMGAVALVEMFRSYRKAGANLLEATCLVAAMLIAGHTTGEQA